MLLFTQGAVFINLSEVMTKSHHNRLWPLVFRFEVVGQPRCGAAREVGGGYQIGVAPLLFATTEGRFQGFLDTNLLG